ncbi:hypothetical protein R7V77_01860 [Mesomycoplasma ovipneumoniae]|uniref:Uncharacterized protein n=1 Tax=Mesomycoplasma ovipneumoniae TaxID=29562 RepID=A0AAJ2P609_9BACT|nr:hypothetical protein [Mesomycoplasma ovipneumoniae]MDW2898059.1 hypothetical protein [Mesomycoplasma ovipneumoniae]
MELGHLIGAISSLVFWSSFGIYIAKVKQTNKIKAFIYKTPKRKRNLTYFYFIMIACLVYGVFYVAFDL